MIDDDLFVDAIEAATAKWVMQQQPAFPWIVTATDDQGQTETVRIEKNRGQDDLTPLERLGTLVYVRVENATGDVLEVTRGGTG